jgi:hypothetical protein
MSDRFAIEANRRVVGVAVRAPGGFRFFSSDPAYFELEGKTYPHARAVTAAAKRLGRPIASTAGALARMPKRRKAGRRPARKRPVRDLEKPPRWFRWTILLGIGVSAVLGEL